jgi:hypothetical protein
MSLEEVCVLATQSAETVEEIFELTQPVSQTFLEATGWELDKTCDMICSQEDTKTPLPAVADNGMPTDPYRREIAMANEFVENNRFIKWCPKKCNNAVQIQHTPKRSVECLCGFQFCFNCMEEIHDLITCEQLIEWNFSNGRHFFDYKEYESNHQKWKKSPDRFDSYFKDDIFLVVEIFKTAVDTYKSCYKTLMTSFTFKAFYKPKTDNHAQLMNEHINMLEMCVENLFNFVNHEDTLKNPAENKLEVIRRTNSAKQACQKLIDYGLEAVANDWWIVMKKDDQVGFDADEEYAASLEYEENEKADQGSYWR